MKLGSRGMSLIETLIAFGVLSLAALGTGAGLNALANAHKKTRVVDTAIEIEAQLLRAMTQNATYSALANDPAATSMRNGTLPAAPITLDLCDSPGCAVNFTIATGQTRCFQSLTNSSVGPCDFTNPLHLVEVQVTDVYSSGGANPKFSIDYVFRGNNSYGALAMTGSTPGATPNSYSVQIPVDSYQMQTDTDCKPITGSQVVVGVSGYDKSVRPYRVSCIRIPDAEPLTCPNGTFPKTLSTVPVGAPSTDLKLQMDCGGSARRLTCPTGYALNSLDPGSLDPSMPLGVNNQCIYRGTSPVTMPRVYTNDYGLIQGEVCPPNYQVDYGASSCVFLSGPTAVDGTCVNWTPTCAACDFTAATPTQNCTYTSVNTTQPPVGPATVGWGAAPNVRSAVCRVNAPAQACGARWASRIEMRIQCILAVPPTQAATAL